MLKLLNYTL